MRAIAVIASVVVALGLAQLAMMWAGRKCDGNSLSCDASVQLGPEASRILQSPATSVPNSPPSGLRR
jgi:DNA polymerase III psi subunit